MNWELLQALLQQPTTQEVIQNPPMNVPNIDQNEALKKFIQESLKKKIKYQPEPGLIPRGVGPVRG